MTLEESFRKYPYYIHPAIMALRDADPEQRPILMRRIAAGVGDIPTLRTLFGIDPAEFRDFYGELSNPGLSTVDTIDLFLDRFSPGNPALDVDPDAMPQEIPVAPPAIDYAAQMLDDSEAPSTDMPLDDTASMLDSFLSAHTPPATHAKKTGNPATSSPEPEGKTGKESEPLSEALVKIMVKNGNYRKALEIITELNLKNPKKSIYFADQIRFLRKLILTQEGAKGTE